MKTSNGKFNPDAKRTLEQDEVKRNQSIFAHISISQEDIERTSTCRVFYPVEADILLKLLVVICNEVCNEYEVPDDTYKVSFFLYLSLCLVINFFGIGQRTDFDRWKQHNRSDDCN